MLLKMPPWPLGFSNMGTGSDLKSTAVAVTVDGLVTATGNNHEIAGQRTAETVHSQVCKTHSVFTHRYFYHNYTARKYIFKII